MERHYKEWMTWMTPEMIALRKKAVSLLKEKRDRYLYIIKALEYEGATFDKDVLIRFIKDLKGE